MSFFDLDYTLQDILGVTLAFCLFPLVIVIPGYIVSSILDLFDFKHRHPIVKLGIGLVISFAVSPVIFNLTSSLFSTLFSLITIGGFASAFLVIFLKETSKSPWKVDSHIRIYLWIGGLWVVFVILSLVDIQWRDQLYFSVVSFDQTSRVSVIEAMTRTGVPPINPSYYPGTPTRLTFLYYFWYILASLIDILGVQIVDARAALNASSAWSGLGLMAAIALYIRLRNANSGAAVWRSARIGIGLLAVSGLDILPTLIIMIGVGRIFGTVEGWNVQMQIPTWISSNLWAPHHIAALVASLSAVMLALSARDKPPSQKFTLLAIAGMAFASSFGLSVWVTLLFGIFWGIWIIVLILQRAENSLILCMMFSGIVAILLASPFMRGLMQTGGDGGRGSSTIIFDVRTLYLLETFVVNWPPVYRSLLMLVLLPFNYFLELGFFFMAGFYWLKSKSKTIINSNPFYIPEISLMAVVLVVGSSLRSTIANNDLGWRVWLPGQFILLIWGVDVIERFFPAHKHTAPLFMKAVEITKTRKFLLTLIVIGVITSSLDAIFLRVTWPFRVGSEAGRQSYSARLAYDFLRDHIPAEIITQNNPLSFVDRPSGLYGTHQMVISDRTVYGVSLSTYHKLVSELKPLFTDENPTNWEAIDYTCQKYSIDLLIFNSSDRVWNSLSRLETERPALYENSHYSLFACGDYAEIR